MLSESELLNITGYQAQNALTLSFLVPHLQNEAGIIPFVGAGLSIPFGFPGWPIFLEEAAESAGLRAPIHRLIEVGHYEEAAEQLQEALEVRAFEDYLAYRYGDRVLEGKTLTGAVTLLPLLTSGPVVTTNFDHMLETAFKDMGHEFKYKVWGAKPDMITKALHGNRRFLLKMHGDVEDREDRILTLTQYERFYGSTDITRIDLGLPLPSMLEMVLLNKPLLFLGCSLAQDRTIEVVSHIAKTHSSVAHYAIVEAPNTDEQFQERRRYLSSLGIRPLWFPTGRYDCIETILAFLVGSVKPRSKSPPLVPPSAVNHAEALRVSMQGATEIALEALKPSILRHIPRKGLLGQYVDTIGKSLQGDLPTAFFIVGPAGYGKSVLLRDLHEALASSSGTWTALVRCEDLDLQAANDDLDLALGYVLRGQAQDMAKAMSATQIVSTLNAAFGQGMLFVDTLDFVLSGFLVPALRSLLVEIVTRMNTTVVFTCRSSEFEDYLLPFNQRLASVHTCDRRVPLFSDDEVKAAVSEYFHSRTGIVVQENAEIFANRVAELSTENRPLHEITHSPLLLALLCNLFGNEGDVPADLTVSKLYAAYWERKIVRSRVLDASEKRRISRGEERSRLCLDMAHNLYSISTNNLSESIEQESLGLTWNRRRIDAYKELRSEHVIELLPRQRVRFFHQTFEEYTIAHWLASAHGRHEKEVLLSSLQSNLPMVQHWWPTVRQLLTMMEPDDFDLWAPRLCAVSVPAFRAVALATVSRDERAVYLLELLQIAFDKGAAYQGALLIATDSAPERLADVTWNVAYTLLQRCEKPMATKVAVNVGERLGRSQKSLRRLKSVFEAIQHRPPARERGGADDRSEVAAKLIESYRSKLVGRVAPDQLKVLQNQYALLGDDTRADIVRFHFHAEIARHEQFGLLNLMLAHPVPKECRREATDLLDMFLPEFTDISEQPLWHWWHSIIDTPLPERWLLICARVMGHRVQQFPRLVELMVADICSGDEIYVNPSIIALQEAAQAGYGSIILSLVKQASAQDLLSSRNSALEFLGRSITEQTFGARSPRRYLSLTSKTVDELLFMAKADDLTASRLLSERAGSADRPDAADLMRLLTSKKAGIRVYGLKGLSHLLKHNCQIGEQQLVDVCAMLSQQTESTTVRHLCQLIGEWTQCNKHIVIRAAEDVGAVPTRLKQDGTHDGGVTRYMLETLNTFSRYADGDLMKRVGQWLRDLLDIADLQKSSNWTLVISLFCRINAVDPTYLPNLVEDLRDQAQRGNLADANAEAVAKAILRCEGKNSGLLMQLYRSEWFPDKAKSTISGDLGLT